MPSETEVIEHLRDNPDFFLRHPILISEAKLPHQSGRTISLVEHQVAILRERNVEMRRRMNELMQTAQANEELFRKTRALTLALLDSTSLHELNEVLATHVLVDFDADFVCTHLVDAPVALDHIRTHERSLPFVNLLQNNQATCTALRPEELHAIFPHSDHEQTGSAVLLPIDVPRTSGTTRDEVTGIFCIGSRAADHFSPDMDTLFVSYISDVLTKVLTRFL